MLKDKLPFLYPHFSSAAHINAFKHHAAFKYEKELEWTTI